MYGYCAKSAGQCSARIRVSMYNKYIWKHSWNNDDCIVEKSEWGFVKMVADIIKYYYFLM